MHASSSLSSSLHKIVLKIERSQITVTAAQFVFKCKWLSYQRPRFSHLTVWRGTRLATATTNEAWSLHPDLTPPPPHSFLSQVQDRKDLEKMHNHCTYGYVFSSPKTFCLWDQSGCSARSRVKNRNSQGQGFFYAQNKTKIKQKTKTKKANQWTVTPFPPASPCGILPGPLWRTFQVTAEGKRLFYPNWEHLMYTRIMSREKAQSSKTCLEINRSVITS